MDKCKIIITGANGQLGQFLIKYIQDNNLDLEVIGTVRHKSYDRQPYIYDKSKVKFELMDLSDVHSIENLIIKYKPEYFINTSANAYVGESWAVPSQQFELNTLGVLHQLESIRKHSPYTRYFNMGTSEEFGNDENDGKLQDENTIINPKSPYGCSKAAARYITNTYRHSYGLYALQGWTFNFESELRGEKYVTKKITLGVARIYHTLKENKEFAPISLGNLQSMRSWQFCGDVVDGIWKMLNQEVYNQELKEKLNKFWDNTHPVGEGDVIDFLSKNIKPYVISANRCNTIKEFVELAFKHAGIEGVWVGNGLNEKYVLPNHVIEENNPKNYVLVDINKDFIRPHDVSYLNGSAKLIEEELGWKSTLSLDDLIKRMVKWDIEHYKD